METGCPVYIRKTNGIGQKLFLDLSLPLPAFNALIRETFSIPVDVIFHLLHQGKLIDCKPGQTLQTAGIGLNSIIHLLSDPPMQAKALNDEFSNVLSFSRSGKKPGFNSSIGEKVVLRLIHNENNYQFQVSKFSSIALFKKDIADRIDSNAKKICLAYLGKQLPDNETINSLQISSNSLLSICINSQSPFEGINVKETKSIIDDELINSTQENSKLSRNIKTNRRPNVLFNGIQIQAPLTPQSNVRMGMGGFSINSNTKVNGVWYNQRIIETESVVWDEENDPMLWVDCQVVLTDLITNNMYTLTCGSEVTLEDVKCKMNTVLRKDIEYVQKLEFGQKPILQICREHSTPALHINYKIFGQ